VAHAAAIVAGGEVGIESDHVVEHLECIEDPFDLPVRPAEIHHRDATSPSTSPAAAPIPARTVQRPTTCRTTACAGAPSAIRMPNSRLRRATWNASTP